MNRTGTIRPAAMLLAVLILLASSADAQDRDPPGITRTADRILAERDAAGESGAMVDDERRELAEELKRQGEEIRASIADRTWIVLALDSLRRSAVADTRAYFDLYEQALRQMQNALDLTGGRYPSEMDLDELAGLREEIRTGVAGRLVEALGRFEQALAANPWDAGVLESMGGVLEDLGRIYASLEYRDRAIEVIRKRLALDPSSYFAHWDLADLLRDTGRKDEALEQYGRAASVLRAYAWEDRGGSPERPVGRRRSHLVFILRERVRLAMDTGREDVFRQSVAEWEPLATAGELKEIAELRRWLNRAGGSLSQALRIDRAWKLIEQGREIEARELLLEAVENSRRSEALAGNVLALADLEFYKLEMQELALGRVVELLEDPRAASLPDSLARRVRDTRGLMTLNLGSEIESAEPLRAYEQYLAAVDSDNRYYPLLAARIGSLLINRPKEALTWLELALDRCDRDHECTRADQIQIHTALTEVYRRLDRAAEARRSWERVMELKR